LSKIDLAAVVTILLSYSIKKITNEDRDMKITGVEDKCGKCLASYKTPYKTDDEECFNSHVQ